MKVKEMAMDMEAAMVMEAEMATETVTAMVTEKARGLERAKAVAVVREAMAAEAETQKTPAKLTYKH